MTTLIDVHFTLQNAQHLQENSALCKVCVNDQSFIVRLVPLILKITEVCLRHYCFLHCSVAYAKVLQMLRERFLLEINERLIKQPDLLNTAVSTSCCLANFLYFFDSLCAYYIVCSHFLFKLCSSFFLR